MLVHTRIRQWWLPLGRTGKLATAAEVSAVTSVKSVYSTLKPLRGPSPRQWSDHLTTGSGNVPNSPPLVGAENTDE
jgi:hypothetical protein